ncbi:MAG TPA: MFS transporter [Symbiobacteriaceae bacterium]
MSYLASYYQDWRRFPRSVQLFYVSDIFFGVSSGILTTLFNLHLLAIGYTPDHVGVLQSVAALVTAISAIPAGVLGDRWSRKYLYVAGSLLFALPYLMVPGLGSYPLLVAIYALGMVGHTLMMVNESPILAGEVGPELRASVFSFMMVNYFIWQTAGIQLAGWLTTALPAGARSQYEWPLVLAGLSGLLSGVIRGLIPFRPQTRSARTYPIRPGRIAFLLAAINLLAGSFTVLTQNFSNVILAGRFAFDTEQIADILTVASILGWIGSLLVPWTSRRIGNIRGYVLVVALQGIALVFMGFAGAPAAFLAAFGLRAILNTMQSVFFWAFAMDVTPESMRATANSIAMVGSNLGASVAAKGYGLALSAHNYLLPFLLAGILAFSTALLTALAFCDQLRVGPRGVVKPG